MEHERFNLRCAALKEVGVSSQQAIETRCAHTLGCKGSSE